MSKQIEAMLMVIFHFRRCDILNHTVLIQYWSTSTPGYLRASLEWWDFRGLEIQKQDPVTPALGTDWNKAKCTVSNHIFEIHKMTLHFNLLGGYLEA